MGNSFSKIFFGSDSGGDTNDVRALKTAAAFTRATLQMGMAMLGAPRRMVARKRKAPSWADDYDEEEDEAGTAAGDKRSTKVIKLDTAKYLHQKLFVEGRKSDVTIVALGHEWHLHKIYLEQCEYFRCLFSGNWKDSEENRYEFEIVDDRITFEGLNAVFSSLYKNEIRFELKNLGGILASSVLFNLQACIERCEELMLKNVSSETVVEFLDLSQRYGCVQARDRCLAYLGRFFWKLSQSDEFLRQLSYEQMVLIYSQPELCVVEGEKDLYNAAKRWVYIQREKTTGCSSSALHTYFAEMPPRACYKYKDLFSQIRFQHMITSKRTLSTLKTEHILGDEILSHIVNDQWETLLTNEEKPLLEDKISDEFFYTHCRRLGRHLTEEKCWRWAGIDFGLDLLVRCQYGMISMIRNITRDPVPYSLSLRKEYKLHYRLLVLNNQGDIVVDTGRKVANLVVDQKNFVISYPADLKEFSVHLFYLNHVPGPAAPHYWQGIEDGGVKQPSC